MERILSVFVLWFIKLILVRMLIVFFLRVLICFVSFRVFELIMLMFVGDMVKIMLFGLVMYFEMRF